MNSQHVIDVIQQDIDYLNSMKLSLRDPSKKMVEKAVLRNAQVGKLKALLKCQVLPKYYISIQTGEVIVSAINDTHNTTKRALFLLFSEKTARVDKGQGHSVLRLKNNEQPALLTLTLPPTALRDDGTKATLHGASSRNVKLAHGDNDKKYAVKKYKLVKNIERYNRFSMRAQVALECLQSESYVTQHGGKSIFIMNWHEPIPIKIVLVMQFKERLKYLLDIAKQLAVLHQHDLVHQDLKPNNLIFTKEGVKFIDLDSIAHLREKTASKSLIHTDAYVDNLCALDIIKKEDRSIILQHLNQQHDVYTLGLVMGFLLHELCHYSIKDLRQATDILAFMIMAPPGYTNIRECVLTTKQKGANEHRALYALMHSSTSQERSNRPVSAVDFYQQLRKIITVKYGIDAPELPAPVKSSEEVLQRLQEIDRQSEAFMRNIVIFHNHDTAIKNAEQYDYHVLGNLKVRSKLVDTAVINAVSANKQCENITMVVQAGVDQNLPDKTSCEPPFVTRYSGHY